jgi:hypothetical protein
MTEEEGSQRLGAQLRKDYEDTSVNMAEKEESRRLYGKLADQLEQPIVDTTFIDMGDYKKTEQIVRACFPITGRTGCCSESHPLVGVLRFQFYKDGLSAAEGGVDVQRKVWASELKVKN